MFRKWLSLGSRKSQELVSDNQGTTAVEFALVSTMFLIVLMGIFEVGAALIVQTTLETAVLQVSRFGRTGSTVTGQTAQQVASGLINTYSLGLVDPNNVVFTVTPYANWASIPPLSQAPNTGTQNYGAQNQPVLYTLSYDWNYFTPLLGKIMSPLTGKVTLTASAIVQNEPFGS